MGRLSRIWQHGDTIGIIMMRTSGICVRIRFRHSHGAVFIAATISAKNDLLQQISLMPGLMILLLSPKGIVLSIMGVRIVQAVLSNIPT